MAGLMQQETKIVIVILIASGFAGFAFYGLGSLLLIVAGVFYLLRWYSLLKVVLIGDGLVFLIGFCLHKFIYLWDRLR
jgi:hypothetical protein